MTCLLPLILAAALPAAAPGATSAAITTSELAGRLSDPALVLIDARPALRDYLEGHIPGAQPLGVENLRSVAGGVPGQILPPEVLAVIVGRLGATAASRMVVYSAENDPDTTFVAGVLMMHGMRSVAVLEGGLKRWVQEQRPVTAELKVVAASHASLAAAPEGLASFDEVRHLAASGGAVLIDARPRSQYEAGRLPGAINRFWKNDLVPEGEPGAGGWREAEALAAEYRALGVTPDKRVIVYCNTGHMASHVFYTLRHRLGFPHVDLYDGSWTEWSLLAEPRVEKAPASPK